MKEVRKGLCRFSFGAFVNRHWSFAFPDHED